MKNVLILTSLLCVSGLAFGQDLKNDPNGTAYCFQNNETIKTSKMVLNPRTNKWESVSISLVLVPTFREISPQLAQKLSRDNESYGTYRATVYRQFQGGRNLPVATYPDVVILQSDVLVSTARRKDRFFFRTYMDELNQSAVYVKGIGSFDLTCRVKDGAFEVRYFSTN